MGLERFATSAVFKVFVPAFVIVLISLLGMWVPPNEMEVRSNAGAPMLAGAVLFHFALMQELPATSYLTRADKLMLGVYTSLLLGMLFDVVDVPREGRVDGPGFSHRPHRRARPDGRGDGGRRVRLNAQLRRSQGHFATRAGGRPRSQRTPTTTPVALTSAQFSTI